MCRLFVTQGLSLNVNIFYLLLTSNRTISVLLWTITIINIKRALEKLDTMDNFNFTDCQLMRLSQNGFKPLLSEENLLDKFR